LTPRTPDLRLVQLCLAGSHTIPPMSHILGVMITDKGINRAATAPLIPGRRRTMKARERFLKSAISTAKSDTTKMPWSRGSVREAHLVQRRTSQKDLPAAARLKRA
jgi:hypothetical protein